MLHKRAVMLLWTISHIAILYGNGTVLPPKGICGREVVWKNPNSVHVWYIQLRSAVMFFSFVLAHSQNSRSLTSISALLLSWRQLSMQLLCRLSRECHSYNARNLFVLVLYVSLVRTAHKLGMFWEAKLCRPFNEELVNNLHYFNNLLNAAILRCI